MVFKVEILDPLGWDTENFDYEFYQERIDVQEFKDRLSHSILSWKC